MKKIVALALALVLVMAAACASAVEVGICQLVQHPALDAATQGFKDALSAKMPDVTFDEQNASGDAVNCATIINTFVSNNVDLILANATPALQAAVAATADIPILGTSITEYGVADLRGANINERVRSLIEIAHPKFRDELLDQALSCGIIGKK